MPVFDTPITTNDASFDKLLHHELPVVLYLFDHEDKSIDATLKAEAKENAGDLLFVRVNISENPNAYAHFGKPALPALLTLDEGEVESRAENVRAADIEAHVDFLLGMGPMPTETVAEAQARVAEGSAPLHVTDNDFQKQVLESDVPVLVDFWAVWCPPCHVIAPVIEELAGEYAGRAKVAKVNVEESRRAAMSYNVRSIPTLLVFKDGKPVGQLVGAHPANRLRGLLDSALN